MIIRSFLNNKRDAKYVNTQIQIEKIVHKSSCDILHNISETTNIIIEHNKDRDAQMKNEMGDDLWILLLWNHL